MSLVAGTVTQRLPGLSGGWQKMVVDDGAGSRFRAGNGRWAVGQESVPSVPRSPRFQEDTTAHASLLGSPTQTVL